MPLKKAERKEEYTRIMSLMLEGKSKEAFDKVRSVCADDTGLFSLCDYDKIMAKQNDKKCVWSQDEEEGQDWSSSCGTTFNFNDDGPSENAFHFCPNCSKPLEEHYHTVDETCCDQAL